MMGLDFNSEVVLNSMLATGVCKPILSCLISFNFFLTAAIILVNTDVYAIIVDQYCAFSHSCGDLLGEQRVTH